jgi:hypothetical protein
MSLDIEYGDFYKFVTSLGIGLIGISILAPWLFLREPFDLLNTQEDIRALTPVAQAIVENRQILVGGIISVLPYFSGITFALGCILLVWGSVLWFTRNQRITDKQHQVTLDKLLREFEAATPQQIESKIRKEVIKTELPETSKKVQESVVSRVVNIENLLIEKIEMCYSSEYEVLSNQRLRDVFFDILLVAKDRFKKDLFVEIKYVRHPFSYNFIQDGFRQIAKIKSAYAEEANSLALGYLLIVVPESMKDVAKQEEIQGRLRATNSPFRKAKTYLRFISEEEIETMDCQRIRAIFL